MNELAQNTALVVEDELFIVLEIEEIVQTLGMSCTALSEVADALKWLETNVPKFAVVDYRLRDTTSEKLVGRLTELTVPTLIYSGNEYAPDLDDPVLGSFPWLSKPAPPEKLFQAIQSLIA